MSAGSKEPTNPHHATARLLPQKLTYAVFFPEKNPQIVWMDVPSWTSYRSDTTTSRIWDSVSMGFRWSSLPAKMAERWYDGFVLKTMLAVCLIVTLIFQTRLVVCRGTNNALSLSCRHPATFTLPENKNLADSTMVVFGVFVKKKVFLIKRFLHHNKILHPVLYWIIG